MKYILKILLFLIICDACKRSDIDVFDIVEEITDYDSVYSDKNDVFNRITDMAILDSVLITKHMNDTYHFSFIDVNGKKIIKRLGKRGRGPGEYLHRNWIYGLWVKIGFFGCYAERNKLCFDF